MLSGREPDNTHPFLNEQFKNFGQLVQECNFYENNWWRLGRVFKEEGDHQLQGVKILLFLFGPFLAGDSGALIC